MPILFLVVEKRLSAATNKDAFIFLLFDKMTIALLSLVFESIIDVLKTILILDFVIASS